MNPNSSFTIHVLSTKANSKPSTWIGHTILSTFARAHFTAMSIHHNSIMKFHPHSYAMNVLQIPNK